MAFSFGFSEDVGSDNEDAAQVAPIAKQSAAIGHQVPVRAHKLDDLVGKSVALDTKDSKDCRFFEHHTAGAPLRET